MMLTQMYNVSATVADELWAERKGSLAKLGDLAGRLVQTGLRDGERRTRPWPRRTNPLTLRQGCSCTPGCRCCDTTGRTRTPRRGKRPGSPL